MGFGGGSGGGGALSAAPDVAFNTPQNNQVLTYDSAISKWKNDTSSTDVENLPAGTTLRVLAPVTIRPTSRADISVIWVGHVSSPVNAIQGDMWLEPVA